MHQRNGRKCITSVEGLESDLDTKRICKALRKLFNCNGNVIVDKNGNDVIQLQGDQRDGCKKWLLEQEIVTKAEANRIVVHGF